MDQGTPCLKRLEKSAGPLTDAGNGPGLYYSCEDSDALTSTKVLSVPASSTPQQLADVIVVDFLAQAPASLSTPALPNALIATMARSTGARGVSLLVRHQVTCEATTCP